MLELFDSLDQKVQEAIEQQRKNTIAQGLRNLVRSGKPADNDVWGRHVDGSVRSVLEKHKDDFIDARYIGELPPGEADSLACMRDLDIALLDLIAAYEKLPSKAF